MTLCIVGTDTSVGKTLVTGLIAKLLHNNGDTVITQKWVQTGSQNIPVDIQAHRTIMKKDLSDISTYMKAVCPYHFKFPASPHLAAEKEGTMINIDKLLTSYTALKKIFNHVLVEGSGGIMVPITRTQTFLDVLEKIAMPTLIVVKNTLGAINHSLLTIHLLKERKIPICGFITTCISPDEEADILRDNTQIISSLSGIHHLCDLPYSKKPDSLELPESLLMHLQKKFPHPRNPIF